MKLHLLTSARVLQGITPRRKAGWTRQSSSLRLRCGSLRPGSFRRILAAVPGPSDALPHLLNNLMNTLARKVKLIRNKAKRFSAAMHIQNLRVSVSIGGRPWAQRAPLPIANFFKFLRSFLTQLALAMSLTQVTDPRTKRQRGAVDVLNVSGRDPAMSLAREKLIECSNGEIETRVVVHAEDNSKYI